MPFPWGLIVLAAGFAYGWFTPGRQRKTAMLVWGIVIGAALAILLSLIGYSANANPVGLGSDALGTFVSVLILTVLFIVGAWLGDFAEHMGGRRRTA